MQPLDNQCFTGEKRDKPDGSADDMETEDDSETWTIDEKERLLQFVTKVFLMNFPSYMAYKHVVHSTLEVSCSQSSQNMTIMRILIIMKTYPCNVYPLIPHFYIAKLGYAGVNLFFIFLLQNIDCGYSLEPPR